MLTLGFALLIAAAEAPPSTQQPAAAPAAKPKKEKKICRDMGPTGTRMGKKKCMTAEEWLAHDNASQMDLDGVK